jgi:hypothetical protein
MTKNSSWPQLLIALAFVYAFGLTIWTLIARVMWSLLSWGEIVTVDPTWSGSFAVGTCIFFLRMLFTSTAKTK